MPVPLVGPVSGPVRVALWELVGGRWLYVACCSLRLAAGACRGDRRLAVFDVKDSPNELLWRSERVVDSSGPVVRPVLVS